MRIILAGPRGFCAGVNMAIESLETALERFGSPVYVYHEIVHNSWVVEDFKRRGAIFVDDLAEVPHGATLLFSAHGVSKEVRRKAEEMQIRAIDATCPLVMRIHRAAARYAAEGHTVVLIGHAGHDEVVGVMGEAPEAIVLVQDIDDVDRLEVPDPERLAYLTQTTLSVNDAAAIIERLKARFPKIKGPAGYDICYATSNRQEAVRVLAAEADIVLVVGSANSSNSKRLAEMADSVGVEAHLVDGPDDISPEWFNGKESVVLTAGASAPEHVVQRCVDFIRERFDAAVESRMIREEKMRFALPEQLREEKT